MLKAVTHWWLVLLAKRRQMQAVFGRHWLAVLDQIIYRLSGRDQWANNGKRGLRRLDSEEGVNERHPRWLSR